MKKFSVILLIFFYLLLSISSAHAIFCSKCGKKNSDDASYCSKCGKKIIQEDNKEKANKSVSTCFEKDHLKYISEVKNLIESGADLNAKYKTAAGTFFAPIAYAVQNNCLEAVKLLIDKGVDIKYTDESGFTLLHTAACASSVQVAEFLIENGLNLNSKNKFLATPLHCAAMVGTMTDSQKKESNIEMVKLLIDKGADINPRDVRGQTPLKQAKTSTRGILQAAGGIE